MITLLFNNAIAENFLVNNFELRVCLICSRKMCVCVCTQYNCHNEKINNYFYINKRHLLINRFCY